MAGCIMGFWGLFTDAMVEETAGVLIVLIFNISFQVVVLYYMYTIIFWDAAVVVEDLSEFQPFRSFDLVKGQWCFVVCADLLNLRQFTLFSG